MSDDIMTKKNQWITDNSARLLIASTGGSDKTLTPTEILQAVTQLAAMLETCHRSSWGDLE